MIREITSADNAAIAAIIRKNLEDAGLAIPGTAYFDEALDRFSDIYGKDDARYYVYTKEGKVVGGIGFARFLSSSDTAELQKLYLDDSVKGMGLGYKLIEHVEEAMRQAGFSKSYLETHDNLQAAIHIYEKSGYREIERPAEVGHSTMNRFFIKDL